MAVGGAHDDFVLIVEDDPSIAEFVQFVLEDEFGVHAVIAQDGEQGLALARTLRPPLVLLDVNLPKLSGLDVARLLRADPATQALALVAMTSTSEIDTRNAGCSDHLAKPFDLDDLTFLVGKYLGFGATVQEAVSPVDPLDRLRAARSEVVASSAEYRRQSAALRARALSIRWRGRLLRQESTRLVRLALDRVRNAA